MRSCGGAVLSSYVNVLQQARSKRIKSSKQRAVSSENSHSSSSPSGWCVSTVLLSNSACISIRRWARAPSGSVHTISFSMAKTPAQAVLETPPASRSDRNRHHLTTYPTPITALSGLLDLSMRNRWRLHQPPGLIVASISSQTYPTPITALSGCPMFAPAYVGRKRLFSIAFSRGHKAADRPPGISIVRTELFIPVWLDLSMRNRWRLDPPPQSGSNGSWTRANLQACPPAHA